MHLSLQKIFKICQDSDFRKIDFLLAQFLADKETKKEKKETIFCISLLTSYRLSQGCIFLNEETLKTKHNILAELLQIKVLEDFSTLAHTSYNCLASSPTNKPLILQEGKIYFQKFFHYQEQVFNYFKKNSLHCLLPQSAYKNLFAKEQSLDTTQKEALTKALHYPLSIISGGPGTGKTFLIGKLIYYLQQENSCFDETNRIKIALLSFTGKAVRRLKEQFQTQKLENVFSDCYLLGGAFLKISTIHSMLSSKESYYYNLDKEEFLWDHLIIDEISMVDLALMCRLLKKIASSTKITLVGDSQQLNPINAGYFFFDLCQALHKNRPPYFALLKTRHRFEAAAENQVLQLVEKLFSDTKNINNNLQEGFYFFENKEDFYKQLQAQAQHQWLALTKVDNPQDAFSVYYSFVILCALNVGSFGVLAIQEFITKNLEQNQKKTATQNFYHGRPILIKINTPKLGIYNGDIGICLVDKQGSYKVYFASEQGFMAIALNDLPQHQSAYALSIHKSQGSEFQETLICLPKEYSEILHRELLYTAITRAKKKVTIFTTLDILQKTLQKNCPETTNLKNQLLLL